MSTIQTTSNSGLHTSTLPKSSSPEGRQAAGNTVTSSNISGINVSAEAQYLFEIDKYLSGLDKAEQSRALNYLSQSDDALQRKAFDHFNHSQEALDRALGTDRTITIDRTESERMKKLLDVDLGNSGSVAAFIPMAVNVFRLDGNTSFYPVQLNQRNDNLNYQLDALEKTAYELLDLQDAANLVGTVRNALYASENILLSFDDVLHYNYTIEAAQKAISFVDAPENLRSEMSNILKEGISYQNNKQSEFLDDARKLLNDGRAGQAVSEDVRLGTAAQLYNSQLQSTLSDRGISVLNARGVVTQLLTQHTDLLRFSADKMDDAFNYYDKASKSFERALHKDFSSPSQNNEPIIDGTLIDTGRDYALKIIEEISNYLVK